jgi:hypothetical protein
MLSLVPRDWVVTFLQLGVLDERAAADFDALFRDRAPPWESVLAWGRRVRERFTTLDLDRVFSIRIPK